jgi:hypothetical protein
VTKEEYQQYLSGPEWLARRKQFLRIWNTCNRCDLPRWLAIIAYDQDLHVHHRHYRNLGNEKPEDLEALCRRCHDIETFGRSSLRSIRAEKCPGCWGQNFDPYSDFCPRCMAVHDYMESEKRRTSSAAVIEMPKAVNEESA